MSGISGAAFTALKRKADEVANDEKVTRERVDALSKWAGTFSNMSLRRRLRWLFLGR